MSEKKTHALLILVREHNITGPVLVKLPEQWADVEPASPLPWLHVEHFPACHTGVMCEGGIAVDDDDAVGDWVGEADAVQDARYIIAACNERPALLATIAALRKQVEGLTTDVEEIRDARGRTIQANDELRREVRELEAENERLRQQLNRLGDPLDDLGAKLYEDEP